MFLRLGSAGYTLKPGFTSLPPPHRMLFLIMTVFLDRISSDSPLKILDFETVLAYMKEIFNLSNNTVKLQTTLFNMMPFLQASGSCFTG